MSRILSLFSCRPGRSLHAFLWLCVLCGVLWGCSTEPADPWAQTELSRAAAEVEGMSTPQDPKVLFRQVKRHIKKPNLYDLHHPQGALASLSPIDVFSTALILEKAGFPLQFDEATLQATVEGKQPHLWIARDRTRVELPATLNRSGFRTQPGVISMTPEGQLRVTSGETMSAPLRGPEEVSVFVKNWTEHFGNAVEAPKKTRILKADEGIPLTLAADGALQIRGQDVTLDELPRKLKTMLTGDAQPIFVQPAPGATYGNVVQALDRLFTVAEGGTPVRYTLPHGLLSQAGQAVGTVRRLRPKPSQDRVLVLKIDAATPFDRVQPILDAVAKHQDRVVLQTQLDLTDPSRITATTWPGGLFGGLTVALAHPTPSQVTEAMAASVPPLPSTTSPSTTAAIGDEPPPVDSTQILQVGGDVQAPVRDHVIQPEYTDIARKARIQGVVIMQVIIDTEGRVQNMKVLKGLPMGLSEEAVKAVRQWTYQPATKNGQPVSVYYNETVNFRLQ